MPNRYMYGRSNGVFMSPRIYHIFVSCFQHFPGVKHQVAILQKNMGIQKDKKYKKYWNFIGIIFPILVIKKNTDKSSWYRRQQDFYFGIISKYHPLLVSCFPHFCFSKKNKHLLQLLIYRRKNETSKKP